MGLGHHIPPSLIAKAKKLKWVQALTTGTETLTAPGVLPPDVILTSTRGIHGPQMSELAFLNMIALKRDFKRNLAQPGRREMGAVGPADPRRQDHRDRRPRPARRASRRTLQAVRHDGDRRQRAAAPERRISTRCIRASELVKLAARADFLMLLVPYSPETHHLIDRDVIAAMKPTAFLINLARGGVLDEAALIEHLQSGKIAGAGTRCVLATAAAAATIRCGGCRTSSSRRTSAAAATSSSSRPWRCWSRTLQAFIDGRLKDMRNVIPH